MPLELQRYSRAIRGRDRLIEGVHGRVSMSLVVSKARFVSSPPGCSFIDVNNYNAIARHPTLLARVSPYRILRRLAHTPCRPMRHTRRSELPIRIPPEEILPYISTCNITYQVAPGSDTQTVSSVEDKVPPCFPFPE